MPIARNAASGGTSVLNKSFRCVAVIALACGSGLAQTDSSPHFEVASVKPASGTRGNFSGGPGSSDPARASWERISLLNLISVAYYVRPDQISGPSWLNTEGYSVTAKMPPETTLSQFRQMLVNLLAERFALVSHRVTKDVSGYELTVAPGGAKITPSPPKPPADEPATPTAPRFSVQITDGIARATFPQASMAFLADRLSVILRGGGVFLRGAASGENVPVTDRTGLSGKFDFLLEYPVPERVQNGPDGFVSASDPDATPARVSAALEKQLGLKLVKATTKVDFLVIDHADRVPAEN
jgi:uncharacterized protein (TIGR03435 family)